jgi:hypothetical protein
VLDEISSDLKRIMWNRIGVYAQVLVEGEVRQGNEFEIFEDGPGPRPALRDVPDGSVDGTVFARALFTEQST